MKNLLLFCLVFTFIACKNKQESTRPEYRNITQSVYASGIIKSREQYQVFTTISGIIKKVFITEGEYVQKGQMLFQIKNEAAEISKENTGIVADFNKIKNNQDKLAELQSSIDLARQMRENDSLLFVRQKNLWASGIGSKAELERKELNAKNSKTNHTNALLKYSELKKQLRFAEKQSIKQYEISASQAGDLYIRSLLGGNVLSVFKKTGELATTQQPLAIISDTAHYYLELQLDEYDIASTEVGMKVFVTMDSYRGDVFEAKLTKIYPVMNDRTKTFTAEAEFVKAPPKIYPNLTVEANILIKEKKNALLIPRSYLLDEKYVLLENGKKAEIKTGIKNYEMVEIISGINQNDVILKPKR
ncbi:MAG: efflux RND transporter periplasmic adaptor subunit [Saprospiraceae bacterium]|nr:efflux RND transporter periplasmic adaptor subunit [Saprospiraceae bacterium]